MEPSDAVTAATSIVFRIAADWPSSPLAGLVYAPPAHETSVEGVVLSVERGIVEMRDIHSGGTRRLIAPPMIAERLRRSLGSVIVIVDAAEHVIGCIG